MYWTIKGPGIKKSRLLSSESITTPLGKERNMRIIKIPADIELLRHELQQVRRASLLATRQGDFRKVAKLTTQAADLNKAIIEAQGLLLEEVA